MLCNIKPVPFHESDKHIFAKIPGGGPDPRSPPPSGSAHGVSEQFRKKERIYIKISEAVCLLTAPLLERSDDICIRPG